MLKCFHMHMYIPMHENISLNSKAAFQLKRVKFYKHVLRGLTKFKVLFGIMML